MEIWRSNNKIVYPIIYETDYDGLGSVNCFLYKQGDDITLIDAGFQAPLYQDFFVNAITQYGIKLTDINRILLTHFHSDHTGLVRWLSTQIDVPIYASGLAIPRILHDDTYLANKINIYEMIYESYGVLHYAERRMEKLRQTYEDRKALQFNKPIQMLSEGDQIAGLQVMHTPGHSPDSISFYDEETGWFFGGDILFETGLASALIEYDEQERMVPSYVQYFHTLAQMELLNISTVFPGHKKPFSNIAEVVEKSRSKVAYKINKIVRQLEGGPKTVEQLGLAFYGPRFEQLFTFTVSDIVGLLQLAEERGLVERELVQGVYMFRVK